MTQSPYSKLPPKAFWRTGVTHRDADDLHTLYTPKFPLSKDDRLVTAGSCFAQHIGRFLKREGFSVIDEEPFPTRGLKAIPAKTRNALGFDLYSARYGNIYTPRQLLQLDKEAHGDLILADPVWEKDGAYYDSQRPNIDVTGFASAETVSRNRKHHLQAVRRAFAKADIFVFTFGLTETWLHRASDDVYPVAPGVIAGTPDDAIYAFENLNYAEIHADFLAFRARLMARNPDIRFLVTVSPVPLTATMTGQHVEVATVRSKSILRAVCADLYETCDNVDYFPSFEMVTSQTNRGSAFSDNLRSVSPATVDRVMAAFLRAHGYATGTATATRHVTQSDEDERDQEDLICEELLLDAFGKT